MISKEGSFYVGHLGPIPLYVHWTFAFLIYMVVAPSLGSGGSLTDALVVLTVLVAGIVLHELGHGYAAKATGGQPLSITLWAFGGVCHSTSSRYPRHELLIVLAGPLVSAILALGCHVALEIIQQSHIEWLVTSDGVRVQATLLSDFLNYGYYINLTLLIFNMLPIYPLDGGQAVHNLMLMVMPRRLANKIAMTVAVVGAIAYVGWRMHQSGGQPDLFLICLLGFMLYQAHLHLNRY